MPQEKKKRKRTVLQERDITLLSGLFESRAMSLKHVGALYFSGKQEMAKKRVQKLKASSYIGERPRRAYSPSVLYLRKKGFQALQDGDHLTGFPSMSWDALKKRVSVSEATLKHELTVMDVKCAVVSAFTKLPKHKAIFSTWPRLFQFQAKRPIVRGKRAVVDKTPMRPDGFIVAEHDFYQYFFFLEVDLSSESQSLLAYKAEGYRDYYSTGNFACRYGLPSKVGFRVLMVFLGETRRNNTAEKLTKVSSMVWLATLEDVLENPLGAIWVRPQDYRQALGGTPYDPRRRKEGTLVKERDAHVSRVVPRLGIFGAGGSPPQQPLNHDQSRRKSERSSERPSKSDPEAPLS